MNDNSQDFLNEFGTTLCQNNPQEKLFQCFPNNHPKSSSVIAKSSGKCETDNISWNNKWSSGFRPNMYQTSAFIGFLRWRWSAGVT